MPYIVVLKTRFELLPEAPKKSKMRKREVCGKWQLMANNLEKKGKDAARKKIKEISEKQEEEEEKMLVSSDENKRDCSRLTRFQRECILSNEGVSDVSEQASEWSEQSGPPWSE